MQIPDAGHKIKLRTHLLKLTSRPPTTPLGQWLGSFGLEHYAVYFEEEGYTDLDDLDGLDSEEVEEMVVACIPSLSGGVTDADAEEEKALHDERQLLRCNTKRRIQEAVKEKQLQEMVAAKEVEKARR